MFCKLVIHSVGRVLTNTSPHQLHLGHWEMGTAVSCTNCSQVAERPPLLSLLLYNECPTAIYIYLITRVSVHIHEHSAHLKRGCCASETISTTVSWLFHKHCSECVWTEDGSEPPKIFHYDMCVCVNQTFENHARKNVFWFAVKLHYEHTCTYGKTSQIMTSF